MAWKRGARKVGAAVGRVLGRSSGATGNPGRGRSSGTTGKPGAGQTSMRSSGGLRNSRGQAPLPGMEGFAPPTGAPNPTMHGGRGAGASSGAQAAPTPEIRGQQQLDLGDAGGTGMRERAGRGAGWLRGQIRNRPLMAGGAAVTGGFMAGRMGGNNNDAPPPPAPPPGGGMGMM